MELRRDIWDRSHSSFTYLAGGHCALPTPVAFWCHLSDTQLSVAGLSPSLVPASGICFRRRLGQLSHCRHSASVWLSSSWSPILMSYSELKHCRLLAFIAVFLFIFAFLYSFLTLPRSSSATGFPDWLIDWFYWMKYRVCWLFDVWLIRVEKRLQQTADALTYGPTTYRHSRSPLANTEFPLLHNLLRCCLRNMATYFSMI